MREVDLGNDLDRLRHAIRDELAVQHGMERRPVDDRWLDTLADVLVARIDYGFDVRWAPKWVHGDEPHRWVEGGECFVECLRCRLATGHASEADADRWYSEHVATHA